MEDGGRAPTAIVARACMTLCLVSYAAAFSQGASLSACSDMMPRHLRVQLHSSNSNYVTVHTNMSFFFPGDKVPVTVRSTRDYMGFMLQARKVSNNEIAGTFIFLPPGSKLLTCFEDGDTVTHSDKSLKRNLSFVWKAPDQPIGDIKFFISIVQSYFVYWAKIESAVVAQAGQNKTLADKKPDAIAPTPLQGPADPHPTGPISPAAATGSLLPASPNGIVATPAPEPGFGVGSETLPVAEPKQAARTLRAVSGRSVRSRGRGLEPSLPTQDVGMVDALQGFLSQDNVSSYSTFNGCDYRLLEMCVLRDTGHRVNRLVLDDTCSKAWAAELAWSSWHFVTVKIRCMEPDSAQKQAQARTDIPTKMDGSENLISPLFSFLTAHFGMFLLSKGSTESGTILKASLRVSETVSPSALHVRTHLGGVTATTAWLGDASTAGNLSSASRQMAERELAPQPERADSRAEEDKDEQEAAGNTVPWVTRPAPESAVPGIGEGPGRGTRLLAAQLGILLVCTAALGLALAAAMRCVCAQHCHKRAEVSFSEPDPDVITIMENGAVMRFRKIQDNSFVLVPAQCNWVSPSSSVKKTVVV
ncbi:reelin domain-containing protein 1 [Haemorhous mexicanus]|uniref:reelin domain-containing protein 1 n=1 Tax=Haemorhous mexicanus TaxID=30427 RepID=UPI0028BF1DE2|nr:reelin domain-containing protein 1 [Haemorhous mexicanus]